MDGRIVVRPGRLGFVVEIPEVIQPAFESVLCLPLAPGLVERDAFEAGAAGASLAQVALILAPGADTQVGSARVASVPVDMVHELARGRLHDLAVHEHLALLLASGGIPIERTPVVSVEPLIVVGVHPGVAPAG